MDVVTPNPPSAPDLDVNDDSGYFNDDNITNFNAGLTFDGTAEKNSTVRLYRSGTQVGSSVTADDTSGNWSIAVAENMGEGSWNMTATATDAAQNTSDPSPVMTPVLQVDITPPVPSLTREQDIFDGWLNAAENSDGYDTIFTVGTDSKGTIHIAPAVGYANKTLLETASKASVAIATAGGGTGNASIADGGVDDGVVYEAYAVDEAGNVSTLPSDDFEVDVVTPNPPDIDEGGTAVEDGWISSTEAVNFSFDVTADESVAVYISDNTLTYAEALDFSGVAVKSDTTAPFSFTFTSGEVDEGVTYAAYQVDSAGNASGPSVENFTMGPAIESAVTRDGDTDGKIDSLEITFNALIDYTTVASDGSDFAVTGYTVTDAATGSGVNDNIVVVTFGEGADPDTAARPNVAIISDISDEDGSTTNSATFSGTEDGAPAVLVAAVMDPAAGTSSNTIFNGDGDSLTLYFSEDLNTPLPDKAQLEEILYFYDDHSGDGNNLPVDILINLDPLDASKLIITQNGDLGNTNSSLKETKSYVYVIGNETAQYLMGLDGFRVANTLDGETNAVGPFAVGRSRGPIVIRGNVQPDVGATATAAESTVNNRTVSPDIVIQNATETQAEQSISRTDTRSSWSTPGYDRSTLATTRSVLEFLKSTGTKAAAVDDKFGNTGLKSLPEIPAQPITGAAEAAITTVDETPVQQTRPSDETFKRGTAVETEPLAGGSTTRSEPHQNEDVSHYRLGKGDITLLAIAFVIGIALPFTYWRHRRFKQRGNDADRTR